MKKRRLSGWCKKKRAVAACGRPIPFVLICILGGGSTEIAAQEPLPLEPGVRVRVTAIDCGLRGETTRLRAFRDDTFVLDSAECPLASVKRLQVWRGRKSNAGPGAAIGAVTGALGAVAYCTGVDETGCQFFDDDFTPALTLLFGVAGGLAGAVVGHLIKTDLWDEVRLERLQVRPNPQRDGRFALEFSVRFD